MNSDTVLGIDPGLNTTGYAILQLEGRTPVIREAGVVRSTARRSIEFRLKEIYDGVSEVFRSFQPSAISLEQLFSHYKRPQTAILMGHARGVICLAAAESDVPVHHYAATKVKKLLTGSGRATKQQVQLAILHEFGLPQLPDPPDVADAMAIALCHLHIRENAVML